MERNSVDYEADPKERELVGERPYLRLVRSPKEDPVKREQEKEEEKWKHMQKGILRGLSVGGGIETLLHVIPGIEQIPYCSEQDIVYRVAIGAITAAFLLPIQKEGEDVKNYWTKALCSGVDYTIGTMIVYGGLEMMARTYERF